MTSKQRANEHHNMNRHRRKWGPTRAALTIASGIALFPLSVAAQSLQVLVKTAFVAPGALIPAPGAVCSTFGTAPVLFRCPIVGTPTLGNISNEPHIEFESSGAARCNMALAGAGPLPGTIGANYCNDRVFLCTQVEVANSTGTPVFLDEISFQLFKFQDGSNALDEGSTPAVRTFFIDAPGSATVGAPNIPPTAQGAACVMWDGSINIQGEFGKSNGQYGFRVRVATNQVGPSGNITVTAVRAYPSGATLDSNLDAVSQKPIAVDVTNVHVIFSSPTNVGVITGVAAQPYNFTYRLSKDATMFLTINDDMPPYPLLRKVVSGLPKIGEGTPKGNVFNGDSWDGRDDQGNVLPPSNYLAVFQANTVDQYTAFPGPIGGDLSDATTRQVGIDPLQITDIRVIPLAGGATSLAVISYLLTEPATAYIDIYPPGTQFCGTGGTTLEAVNNPAGDPGVADPLAPAKKFGARLGLCAPGVGTDVAPVRTISEVKTARSQVFNFWDGLDTAGKLVEDGDYVFLIYAALPSQRGALYRAGLGGPADRRVWTSIAKVGFLPVLRGLVGITQIAVTATTIGSSPTVSGVNPFTFGYNMTRDAIVSMKIFNATGATLVKTLVDRETRPGFFANVESWPQGTDDAGNAVSSGTYLVQLTATDAAQPSKVSTVTAMFPVNMFRVIDVEVVPLLAGASENVVINYQLTQPMFVSWNIYPPGSVIVGSANSWPPCAAQSPPAACTTAPADPVRVQTAFGAQAKPIFTTGGISAGRLKISEFWDGRDLNGLFVPDGNYVFTLTVQSTTTPKYFPTDKVFGNVTVARGPIIFTKFTVLPDTPQLFFSSNTITLHPFLIEFALTRASSVTIQVLNTNVPPGVVRTILNGGSRSAGLLEQETWDGRTDAGGFPPAGTYIVRAVAHDEAAVETILSTATFIIAYDPLRIYDLAITPLRSDDGSAVLSYQVSETMKIAIKIFKTGTVFDPAGNPTPPEAQSLVKRIVGVRPARTPIEDTWDGTDFKFALLKDGTYKFKIVGSTDMAAIDDRTGNVLNPAALSLDRLTDEIPVIRNASLSPNEDFINNTFNYPNPVTGDSTKFHIYSPFRAKVKMKLHTMSGELVLDKNFGEVQPSFQSGPVEFVWTKINQSGNKVVRGLYFAVIRIEETEGGKNVLQTVKKVLIQ